MKKKNRVRKAQEFQSLIHTGEKKANQSFVLYSKPKKEGEARIGITLPRKIGNAVERNLIKRQVRMMCQDLIDFTEASYDVILIVRFGYKENSFAKNKNNLEKLLLKAKIK
jgi:ribonuclease P protein component